MTPPAAPGPSPPGPRPAAGWVVSPAFDLLFLANVYWVVLLWPGLLPAGRAELATEFWAVYFLIAPHRWVTLVLVAADPARRDGRPGWVFVAVAAGAGAAVAGVWAATGAFACLALADYLWNAWHFAAQHHGVARMYARKAGGGPDWLDRHALRLFLCYVLLRTAGWTTGWVDADPAARPWLDAADLGALAVPAAVLGAAAVRRPAAAPRVGRLAYLASLLGLYTSLLLALRNDWRGPVIALTAAASMFHATEYLAVVTHYARRRAAGGPGGLFRRMAGRWAGLLAVYAVVLGAVGVWMARPGGGLADLWVGLNLWAAFVHYAYDGMIWKLRRPATAAALGVPG